MCFHLYKVNMLPPYFSLAFCRSVMMLTFLIFHIL